MCLTWKSDPGSAKGPTHRTKVGANRDVLPDTVVPGGQRHDQQQRVSRHFPDLALAMHERDEQ